MKQFVVIYMYLITLLLLIPRPSWMPSSLWTTWESHLMLLDFFVKDSGDFMDVLKYSTLLQ